MIIDTVTSAQYIGSNSPDGYSDVIVQDQFFLALTVVEGVEGEQGKEAFAAMKSSIRVDEITSLPSLESAVTNALTSSHLPAHVSIAAGKIHNGILYVKTVGNGQIYLRRNSELALLIEGDKSGSGYLNEFDCAFFTTDAITRLIGTTADIKAFVEVLSPQAIIDKMHAEEYSDDARGFAIVISEFSSHASQNAIPMSTSSSNPASAQIASERQIQPPASSPVQRLSRISLSSLNKRRTVFLVLALMFFAVLIWSVVFGYKRRKATVLKTHIADTKTLVARNIQDAQDEAFLDINKSLDILQQAKASVKQLSIEANGSSVDEISAISAQIDQAEKQITKKEVSAGDEYYDLSLENKNARGVALNFENGSVAILDPQLKTVFVLTLTKKSLSKFSSPEIEKATRVALNKGDVYVYVTQKGVYKFTSENKAALSIAADPSWGTISDMTFYNGNIYMLDKGKKAIYKFSSSGSSFSEASTYLQDGSTIDSKADALAIDSSIYVTGGAGIDKFVRGSAEKFEIKLPENISDIAFNAIYTDPDMEKIVSCDAVKAACIVFTKKGEYLKQLQSAQIKSNKGMFVYENKAYLLSGSKLYTIALD